MKKKPFQMSLTPPKANSHELRDWIINRGALVKTYPEGRRCKFCNKKISVSNESNYCYVHQNYQIQKMDDELPFTPRRKNAKH